MLALLPLLFALATPDADPCQGVRISLLAPATHAGQPGLLVVLRAAAADPPTAGTLRLLTPRGHADLPFTSSGTVFVQTPPQLTVTGASLVTVDGFACNENGVSLTAAPPGVDISAAAERAPAATAGGEVADDGPHCSRPFVPPAVLQAQPPPAVPAGAAGRVQVLVSLDSAARLLDATVVASDDPRLNASALASARGSTYSPAISLCTPVSSKYLFAVFYGS